MNRITSRSGAAVPRTSKPYILAVTSQKGGTGRTTTALALAWTWGRLGLDVTLVDADPVGSTGLVASAWRGVRFVDGRGVHGVEDTAGDLVVIDAPALTSPEAPSILAAAHGVLLTGLADPLSLRTISVAVRRLAEARETNPWLKVVGLLITAFDASVPLQNEILRHLRATHPELLVRHQIPESPELRDWPASLIEGLPDGASRASYSAVGDDVLKVIRPDLLRLDPALDIASWGEHLSLGLV